MAVEPKITWGELVKLEPRLLDLYRRAQQSDPSNENCWEIIWFGEAGGSGLKREMMGLVGWEARTRNEALRSPDAYDVAYNTILSAIPKCRNCRCEE